MKAGVASAALLVLLTFDSAARACACGVPGLESALTSKWDRWGTRLAQNLLWGHGRWNAHGGYQRLPADAHDQRYELEALAALRPLPAWELSASTSYGRTTVSEAGLGSSGAGLGDTFARARYDAIDEAPSHRAGIPWPSLALAGSLRLPTASTTSAANLGLGAYELGVGAIVERTLKARFRLGASGMLALRAPDDSLGASRRLGPRVTAQVTGSYWPTPNLALSVASSLAWEDDVTYAGQRQAGSGSRLWQVGAGISFRPDGSAVRSGLRVRSAPPLPAVSANAVGDTSVELSLAYVR